MSHVNSLVKCRSNSGYMTSFFFFRWSGLTLKQMLPSHICSKSRQFFGVSVTCFIIWLPNFPSRVHLFLQAADRNEPLGKVHLASLNSSPADAGAKPFASTQPASSPTAHTICRFLLVSPLPPQDSLISPFCFNSSLITSHVPHQVLISSLLLRVCQTCKHARAGSQKNARARAPNCRYCSVLPTLVCQRAHAYLKRLLRGHVLPFKHVSLERKYLHPETLIITHAQKRQTHPLTNYIKRIPTSYISRFTSQK